MEVNGQLHTLATLPSEKEPLLITDKEAGWTLEPVSMQWERGKTNHCPCWESNPSCPAHNNF